MDQDQELHQDQGNLVWIQPSTSGEGPSKRSGHSMAMVGSNVRKIIDKLQLNFTKSKTLQRLFYFNVLAFVVILLLNPIQNQQTHVFISFFFS